MSLKISSTSNLMQDVSYKPHFPCDEYVNANIISYQIAALPPGLRSASPDPVLSVRFLFANAEDTRKWTNWLRISYSIKSNISNLFKQIPNIPYFLSEDCTPNDTTPNLWNTSLQIFCEITRDPYSRIAKVRMAPDGKGLDVKTTVWGVDFFPQRYVKAYGSIVPLLRAGVKVVNSNNEIVVQKYDTSDLIDNSSDMMLTSTEVQKADAILNSVLAPDKTDAEAETKPSDLPF